MRSSRVAMWALWVVTRASFVTYLLLSRKYSYMGDLHTYRGWSAILARGTFPTGDPRWQYPPLAGPVLLLPRLLGGPGGGYQTACVLLLLLLDLVIMVILARRARQYGAWVWTVGLAALGPIVFGRYDMVVTLPAVLALLALPRTGRAGALAAAGAMLKVWPALLLLSLPRDRRGLRGVVGFGAAAMVLLGGLLLWARDSLSFLTGQADRGLQMESVPATPLQIMRAFGYRGLRARYQYGSQELLGHGAGYAATACLVASAIALIAVAVLAWRRSGAAWTPAYGCDVALAAVLAAIVTSRVLSPQYLVWLIGIAAVCMTHAESRQRAATWLIIAAAGLSDLEFPLFWNPLTRGAPLGVAVLTARNAALVAALVFAVVRLARPARLTPTTTPDPAGAVLGPAGPSPHPADPDAGPATAAEAVREPRAATSGSG